MLAALTGALTASRLGIAGTIIGAAFMSLASTVGSAIYKHYITSSNERLRAAAASLAPKASHSRGGLGGRPAPRPGGAGPAGAGPAGRQGCLDRRPDPARRQSTAGPTRRYPVRELGAPPRRRMATSRPTGPRPDLPARYPNGDLASARTQTFAWDQPGPDRRGPATGAAWAATRRPPRPPTERSGRPADLVGRSPGRPRPGRPGDPGRPDQSSAASPAPDAGHRWPWARRRWVIAAATALGVFVVTMGAVTVFEVLAGKPLDAVVWHQHSSGTTLGGLVGGSGGHHPRPSTSPTPSHSPGSSHSPRPSHTPSSTPTPTTSSPTPTPSGSPSPSSSATPSGNASSPPRRTRPRPPPRPRHRAHPPRPLAPRTIQRGRDSAPPGPARHSRQRAGQSRVGYRRP